MAVAHVPSQAIGLPRRGAATPARRSSGGMVAWLPLATILVGIVSLFYLVQTSDLTTTGYSVQQLQAGENDWKLRNEQLSLELSRARSLATVEAVATGRLLMVPPKEVVYLRVSAPDPSQRFVASSRGEGRDTPALSKSESQPAVDPLEPVRDSLASLLMGRPQPSQR